jgi:hypothetical protein
MSQHSSNKDSSASTAVHRTIRQLMQYAQYSSASLKLQYEGLCKLHPARQYIYSKLALPPVLLYTQDSYAITTAHVTELFSNCSKIVVFHECSTAIHRTLYTAMQYIYIGLFSLHCSTQDSLASNTNPELFCQQYETHNSLASPVMQCTQNLLQGPTLQNSVATSSSSFSPTQLSYPTWSNG